MDNSLDDRMQRQNLIRLLEALRGLPLHHVKVIYAGEHGRVTHCLISASPIGTEHHLSAVTVEQFRPAASPSDSEESLSSESLPLTQALQNFALHWASLQFGHWQSGDGSKGVMRANVSTGQLTLDHDAFVVEQFHAKLSEQALPSL